MPWQIAEYIGVETFVLNMPVALEDGLSRCQIFGLVPEGSCVLHQHITERRVSAVFGLVADGVFFAEIFGFDDDVRHSKKRKAKS